MITIPILADYKETYDRDGFVIVRQLLGHGEFAELVDNLHRLIRDVVPTLPDSHAFYHDRSRPETLKQMQFMGVDPFFREYTRQPDWKALAEALIGEEANSQDPEWFNKPPSADLATPPHMTPPHVTPPHVTPPHVTPPHQDNYYFNLKPANVVTIWMALDRVEDENGCLRYVAGSHREGFRPHDASNVLGFSQGITDYGPADESRESRIHLEPGDVVAHHGMTIHRAEANRSPTRNRRAFAMVFKGVSCRRDEEAYARYQAACKAQHERMGLKTA